MGVLQVLLVATPGFPALLALVWPTMRRRKLLMALAPWAAAPGLALALHPGGEGTAVAVPALFTGLQLELDGTGRPFLILTALLWLAAGVFAGSYHRGDRKREGFFAFFVLTMAGNLGLVVAADILSFYLFFVLMTFAAYGLVAHRRDADARRAGRIYIVMAIVGEMCLLAGLLALGWAASGVPAFGLELQGVWATLDGLGWGVGVAALFVTGFGVKAGIVPLHLWLPLAHPVAPTAASALLSGAMIKAGVLAWIRFTPAELGLPALGGALAVVGLASALYGVLAGLAQDDPKTVLAYSSVSQMGYMALGIGLALRSPGWAPVAVAAVVLWALHHGLAKGALFLAVGVGDRTPGGPRSRWGRFVLLASAFPALALSGAPLTTGGRAKGSLKAALGELAPEWYESVDPVLLIASVGTTLLMVRFLITLGTRMQRGEGRGDPARSRSRSRPSGGGAPAVGLVAPWIILLVLGATGTLWLPAAVTPASRAVLPSIGAGWAAAAGPVLVGALVGWVLWRRPRLLGPFSHLRLPPGDLVVPLEATARRLRRLPWGVLEEERGRAVAEAVRRMQQWSHARAAWAAERDIHLARGPLAGLLLLGLALALALALSMG